MPLKPCRECGHEVSTEATSCPHCGVPRPAAPEPDAYATGFAALSDEELRRMAEEKPPSVPAERAALAAELRRRSDERRRGSTGWLPPASTAPPPPVTPIPPALQTILQGVAGPAAAPASSSNWMLWGCLLPIVLFAGCFVYFAGKGQQQVDLEKQYGSSTMAAIMCEDFVKRRLTSPGSAKFPGTWSGELGIDSLGAGRFRVRSHVDAQNAFGGLLRSRFVCRIAKVSGGDEWRLEDLTMER